MRIAGLVLGILGGLAAGLLGMKWLSDASELSQQIALAQSMGVDTGDITRLKIAAWLLVTAMVLGIAGGVMALLGKGKPAAGALLAGGLAPVFFAPVALIFTWLLVAGGVCSALSKPKTA